MSILSNVPVGFQTRYFREIEGNTLPEIYVLNGSLYIPVFIRQTTREDATMYLYYVAVVPFKGQDYGDYAKCLKQCYSGIRAFFYASSSAQSEMRDDATWEAHRQSVRTAFPKYDGEINQSAERFTAIKDAFWTCIDDALKSIGKTRSDLPSYFDAETMLVFASENGMDTEEIAEYSQKFATLSLDLLHNGRNWKELFV